MVKASRPRIALVTSGFGPRFGGIGVVAKGIPRALAADAEITIWRHRPNWPSPFRGIALLLRALAGSIRRPDFIIFTHIDLARLMLVSPLVRNVPYAVLIYGVEVWRPLDPQRRRVLERAAAVISISEFTVKKARETNPWLPETRVVWLGTDTHNDQTRQVTPIVLMLGRMASTERYKGHDKLIDAWPRVVAAVPGAQAVIIGDGDDRARLEKRAHRIPSITFAGFLSDERVQTLLRSSAALVSISSGEGFGLAALEAAAAGTPVIALKGTVTEELFPGGCGHVLLESLDADALAKALVSLLISSDRAQTIGSAGMRRVREMFTIEHFCQRLRTVLMPLLSAQ